MIPPPKWWRYSLPIRSSVGPSRSRNVVSTIAIDFGTGSPHGADTIGQNGEPCVTRSRRYQTPPTATEAPSASTSGLESERNRLRAGQKASASTSATQGRVVVLHPIDRAPASSAGASSPASFRLSAHSAAHVTSQASAAGSVTVP